MTETRTMKMTLVVLVGLVAMAGFGCGGGSTASGTGGKSGTGGSSGTGTGGMTAGGTGGSSGGPYIFTGACGQRGMGTGTTMDYNVPTTFFITADSGQGDDVCLVKFDVKRVGTAPAGCTDCTWTHQVAYSNPMIMLNTNGACNASESVPSLDMASVMALSGTQFGVGFSKLAGHGNDLMTFDTKLNKWIEVGRASWNEPTGDLGFNIRTGLCQYGK